MARLAARLTWELPAPPTFHPLSARRTTLEGAPAAELALLAASLCDDLAGRAGEMPMAALLAAAEVAGTFPCHVSEAFIQVGVGGGMG